MSDYPTLPQQFWLQFGAGAAALCSSVVFLAAPNWLIRLLSLGATLGSGFATVVSIQNKSRKSPLPENIIDNPAQVGSPLIIREYDTTWTSVENEQQVNFQAKALMTRSAEQIIFRLATGQDGVYILELKQKDLDQVSGIWWHYPAGLAHGLYQGRFSEDRNTIIGTWQTSTGNIRGDWNFTASDFIINDK
ncbi:MAG: hypothetical protein NW237_11590 [Cyanobacteriota bacterium]|nr:hypothetical protein [Cyanobacteriota bacterium]